MPEEIQTDEDGIVRVESDKSEKADTVRIDYGGVLTTLALGGSGCYVTYRYSSSDTYRIKVLAKAEAAQAYPYR